MTEIHEGVLQMDLSHLCQTFLWQPDAQNRLPMPLGMECRTLSFLSCGMNGLWNLRGGGKSSHIDNRSRVALCSREFQQVPGFIPGLQLSYRACKNC